MAVERRSIVRFEQDLQREIAAATSRLADLTRQRVDLEIRLGTLEEVAAKLARPTDGDEGEA